MREHLPAFSYTKKDFNLDWFSGSGAGGQNRNKTQNCLRLTHIPSGITVTAQNQRERSANLRDAFRRLKPQLLKWIKSQMHAVAYGRSNETVRTYHEPDNYVKDHSSGETIAFSELDKRFPDLVEARLRSGPGDTKSGRG